MLGGFPSPTWHRKCWGVPQLGPPGCNQPCCWGQSCSHWDFPSPTAARGSSGRATTPCLLPGPADIMCSLPEAGALHLLPDPADPRDSPARPGLPSHHLVQPLLAQPGLPSPTFSQLAPTLRLCGSLIQQNPWSCQTTDIAVSECPGFQRFNLYNCNSVYKKKQWIYRSCLHNTLSSQTNIQCLNIWYLD